MVRAYLLVLIATAAAAAAFLADAVVTPLAPGAAAAGSVPAGAYAYYNGTVTGAAAVVLLTLLTAGQADVYVSLGAGRPLPSAGGPYDYAARWAPALPLVAVRIIATDAAWVAACGAGAAACPLTIGVHGGTNASNFTLAYRGPGDALALAPGTPAVAPVPPTGPGWGGRVTFALPVPTGPDAPLDLVAATLSLTGLDAPLAAYFGSSLKGGPPNPADPSSYCQAWSYGGAAVKVNAVAFTSFASDGDCWCGPNAAPPAGRTTPSSADGDCAFYVTVTTASDDGGGGGTSGAFVQVAGTYAGAGPQALLDGVPTQGAAAMGAGAQFAFTPVAVGPAVALGVRTIALSVQPLGGSVDVYVTLDGSTPSPANAALRSVGVPGLQLLSIDVSPGAPFAGQCDTGPGAPVLCFVRIGLYGTAPANTFLLTAGFSAYTRLLPGVPYVGQLGYAADGSGPQTALFALGDARPTGAGFTLSLTAYSNRPRMAGGSDAPALNGSATAPRPSVPGTYTWGPAGDGSYTVRQPAPAGAPNLTATTLYVGVSGRDDPAERTFYSLVASFAAARNGTSSFTLLQLGLPQEGVVANRGGDGDEAPAVYELPWPSADTLALTLTTQNRGGGNVRLAVNLGTLPVGGGAGSGADYDLRSPDALKEVPVSQTDPQFQARCPNGPNEWCVPVLGASSVIAGAATPLCESSFCRVVNSYHSFSCSTVFVRVFADGDGADARRFTVGAYTTSRVLPTGSAVQGQVGGGGYDGYFLVVGSTAQPLRISVAPLSGSPVLYVSAVGPAATAANSQWSTAGTLPGGGGVVTVTWTEPVWNGTLPALPFTLFVGVYAAGGSPAVYSLLATYDTDVPVLSPSLSTAAALAGGALTYFAFDVPPWIPPSSGASASAATADPSFYFDAVLTPASGGSAGTAPAPLVVVVSNVVDSATGDTLPPTCAGVQGNTSCDGVHFFNAVWAASSAQSPSGGSASAASVAVSAGSHTFTNGSRYVIGVYSALDTVATVLAADAASLAQLPAGVSVPLSLPGGACAFFQLTFVGADSGSSGAGADTAVELSLTLTAGDAALFASISPSVTRPTAAAHDYAAREAGVAPGVVTVPWADVAARGAPGSTGSPCAASGLCSVYVSACSAGGGVAQATLTGLVVNASSIQTVALGAGSPVSGFVPSGQARYYAVTFNGSALPFYSLALQHATGGPGAPDLYVRLSSSGVPSPQLYDATTAGTGRPYLTLSATGGGPFCALSACTLIVAVVAAPGATSGAAYALVFLPAGAPAALAPGLPFRVGVPRGTTRQFTLAFPTDDAAATLRFAVSAPGGPPASYYVLPWASGAGSSGSPSLPLPLPMPLPGPGAYCANLTAVTAGVVTVTAAAPATAVGCWCTHCHQVLTVACPPPASAGAAAGSGGDGAECDVTVVGTVTAPGDGLPAITTLAAGQPVLGAAPSKGDAAFFTFSLAHLLAAGGGLTRAVAVTVTADSGPAPAVYATNAYLRGLSPPSALPVSRASLWSDAGSLLPGTLYIPAGDAAFTGAGCIAAAGSNCTDVTLGVVAHEAPAAYRVVWFVVDEGAGAASNAVANATVTRLDLGHPTGTIAVASGASRVFAFTLPAGFNAAAAAAVGAAVTVTATNLGGPYALAVDVGAAPAPCVGGVAPGAAITCGGSWVSLPDSGGGPIVINSSAPCAPAGGATVACNASAAWNPAAPYYVSLYGAGMAKSSVLLSLTAVLSTATAPGIITLHDGLLVAVVDALPMPRRPVTGAPAPLPPAFAFASQHDPLAAPPVEFTITKTAPFLGVLTVSISSCVSGRCSPPGVWWPSVTRGSAVAGVVAPFDNASVITLDTTSAAGYCRDGGLAQGAPGAPCVYLLTVDPECVDANGVIISFPPSPTVCTPASFTVAASTPGADGAPVAIPSSASKDGAFAVVQGGLTPPVNYSYQALLWPGTARLTVVLEASGPAGAAVYICDPTLGEGAPGACDDAIAPSSSDHTYALRTADGGGPTGSGPVGGGGGGRAVLSVAGLATQGVYLTLAQDAPGNGSTTGARVAVAGLRGGALRQFPGGTAAVNAVAAHSRSALLTGTVCGGISPLVPLATCTRYRLLLAAGSKPVLLAPPTVPGANITVVSFGPAAAAFGNVTLVPVTLTWPPYAAVAADPDAPAPAVPLQRVVYRVYAAPGGFAAAGTGAQPATALGLEAWAAAWSQPFTSFSTAPLTGSASAAPSLTVTLVANTTYQLAVVAVCDAACWAASRVAGGSTTQALAGLPSATVNVPAAAPSPGPSPPAGASPAPSPAGPAGGGGGGNGDAATLGAAIGGSVGGALLMASFAAGLVALYRRRRGGPSAPRSVRTGPTKADRGPNRFTAREAGGIARVAVPDWDGRARGGSDAVATVNPAAELSATPRPTPSPSTQ